MKPCPEWIETNPNGWMNFITDMGPAPTVQHSLDRINPHIGYGWYLDPEDGLRKNNCRWATATEQANNQKRHWAHWAPERIAAFKAAQEQEVVEAEVLEDDEEA